MKTFINEITDDCFSVVSLFAVLLAVSFTQGLPWWVQVLACCAAAFVAFFVNGFLRGVASLDRPKKRVKA